MNIIIGPIITEKSMSEAAKGKYTFKVMKSANKTQIKRDVEKKFKVNVKHVATSMVRGKTKRTGTKRMEKKHPDYKKAMVAVKEGQKIGLFELGGEENSK